MVGQAGKVVLAVAVLLMVGACQAGSAPPTAATPTTNVTTTALTGSTPPAVASPSAAISPSAVTAIAVGSAVCELHADGVVVCRDQGNPTPTAVGGIANATAISSDLGYTCALLAGGGVMCWGLNATGQLGDGTLTNSRVPVPVSGITDAIAIEAGQGHACAIRSGGSVMCWGDNSSGQLGSLTPTAASPIPLPVPGIDDATALAAGETHTCAIRVGGGVKCWGSPVQLGNGSESALGDSSAVSVSGITDAVAITAGSYDTCVVLAGGAPMASSPPAPSPATSPRPQRDNVRCWGWDMSQLDSTVFRSVPVAVPGIHDATAVAAGLGQVCVVRGGGVVCWGRNEFGALGDGTDVDSAIPVPVPNIKDAVSISSTGWSTCVLTSGGSVKCWGQ